MRRVTKATRLHNSLLLPIECFLAARNLRTYKVKRATIRRIRNWAMQFPAEYRRDLVRLARHLIVVSEEDAIHSLVKHNDRVLKDLREFGVGIDSVIYVTTDKAASSSHVMLSVLRDRSRLELRGAHIIDSMNVQGIQERTRELQKGAIIYVDDFAGTGKQFVRSRKRVAEHVVGTFSEFFVLPCICDEALRKTKAVGVEACADRVHTPEERPLHRSGTLLSRSAREGIVELGRSVWGKASLGFDKLATNVIMYRNAPNTTPLIFRGNRGQQPMHGIVPRYDDLGNGEGEGE